MNSEKKKTLQRVVIYYIAACLPLIIATPILNRLNGAPIFADMQVQNMNRYAYGIGVFGMFAPSLAVLLTRLLTREGMKDAYLELHMKGNGRYYLLAIVLRPLLSVISIFLLLYFFFRGEKLSAFWNMDVQPHLILVTIFMQLASSIVFFFPAFGEEWGWRGYLMPKLTALVGRPGALVLGGVLWGLWHAPLTVSGHNFGLDYPGFPWLGILCMCGFCILMNVLLTWLTERTKSIYPASFCHMINNNLAGGVLMVICFSPEGQARIEEVSTFARLGMELIPLGIAAGVCGLLFLKAEK